MNSMELASDSAVKQMQKGTLHVKQSRIVKINVHIRYHQDDIYATNKSCNLQLMKINVFGVCLITVR